MPIIKGQVVRARYTSLKLNELSAVDRPAQPGATMAILKRAPDEMADKVVKYCDTEQGARTFATLLTEAENRRRYWEAYEAIYPLMDALSDSVRSIIADQSLSNETRQAMIRQSAEDFLNAVREKAPEVETELAKLMDSGSPIPVEKGPDMKTIEQLEAEIVELNKSVTGLNAQIVTLTADLTTQKAALVAEKAAHVATQKSLTEATDEVIKVGDTEVRKSVAGDAQFAVAKALLDERDTARIEKRVSTEFNLVPGTDTEKALVIKHLSTAGEEVVKTFESIMTAAQKAVSGMFQTQGHRHEEVRKASQDFEATVSEIQKRDGVTRLVALEKATAENPEAFAAYQEAGQAAH